MWTKQTPTKEGYYWNCKENPILYHFALSKDNVLFCNRCDELGLEKPEDVKGEWYGPVTAPVKLRKIIVQKRADDYIAYFENAPKVWEVGKTYAESLGQLLMTYAGHWSYQIEYKP